MSNYLPTAEQQAIIDAFATGKDMVIEAGAGTGKTSTLRMLGESTDREGLYLAYNKAIQTDAKASFPGNIDCRTAHSMAWGGIVRSNKWIQRRLKAPRVTSKQAVTTLGIPASGLKLNDEHELPAWIIARLAMETVGRFCNSADDEIKGYHVPKVEGVEDRDFLVNYVLPFAHKTWADITNPNGVLKFQHDHYLKMWALTNPRLRADFILFDEAQDANPVIAKIVMDQDCQKVMVGDRCQAIYGWRGAVDAMSNFEVEHRLVLSQSFRFGPVIAEQANIWLDKLNAPLRLSGFDKIDSKVEQLIEPDAILCRTNAEVIAQAMAIQESGKKVAIVGGTKEIESFAYGVCSLMKGERPNHPDLAAFETWAELLEYVKSDEGKDLKVMVNLILMHGLEAIFNVCKNSHNEKDADVIVSTAHKAKGREWDRVRIGTDFKAPEEGAEPAEAEMMLMYVAVTRARKSLDNAALSWAA